MDGTSKSNGACTAHLDHGSDLTELESCMVKIIKIFHSYSGVHCKLRKKDLKELINSQMTTFVKLAVGDPHKPCDITTIMGISHNGLTRSQTAVGDHDRHNATDSIELMGHVFRTTVQIQDPKTLDFIFTDLDANHDSEIDFSEFSALIAMVTSACHASFHEG